MSEPHGEFCDYDTLQPILRRVADLRKLSRQEIDRLAGFTPGYASKRLAEVPEGKLGPETLGGMAGALGLKFIAVDDPEALAKYTSRGEKRVEKYALNAAKHGGAVHFKISLRKLRQNGRKGGANSRKFVGKRKARKLARKAARARWHKPKLVEIKSSAAAAHLSPAPTETDRQGIPSAANGGSGVSKGL